MIFSKNRIEILGRAGRDAELKQLEGGALVCRVSIATNRRYKNKSGETVEDTQWHNCVAWGDLAKLIADRIRKGHEVLIEGELRYRPHYKFSEVLSAEIRVLNFRDFTFDEKADKQSETAPTQQKKEPAGEYQSAESVQESILDGIDYDPDDPDW